VQHREGAAGALEPAMTTYAQRKRGFIAFYAKGAVQPDGIVVAPYVK